MSQATLNRVIDAAVKLAKDAGEKNRKKISVHDLRRTGSTLLHEAGFNSDWIEKCLAHEQEACELFIIKLNMRNSVEICFSNGLTWLMVG